MASSLAIFKSGIGFIIHLNFCCPERDPGLAIRASQILQLRRAILGLSFMQWKFRGLEEEIRVAIHAFWALHFQRVAPGSLCIHKIIAVSHVKFSL